MSNILSRDQLPTVIRIFLDHHQSHDIEGTLATFAKDAIVIDEGQRYVGVEGIRSWLNRAASEYTYTSTETDYTQEGDDHYRVDIHLSGNFPGGEADLISRFTVHESKITLLDNG